MTDGELREMAAQMFEASGFEHNARVLRAHPDAVWVVATVRIMRSVFEAGRGDAMAEMDAYQPWSF